MLQCVVNLCNPFIYIERYSSVLITHRCYFLLHDFIIVVVVVALDRRVELGME